MTPAEAHKTARGMLDELTRLSPGRGTSRGAEYAEHVSVLADVLAYTDMPDLGVALATQMETLEIGLSRRPLNFVVRDVRDAFVRGTPLPPWFFEGRILPPRSVQILIPDGGTSFLRPFIEAGGYGFAEAWSLRAGNVCEDGGNSEPGERTYAVAKHMGATFSLWYRARAVRFVHPAQRLHR